MLRKRTLAGPDREPGSGQYYVGTHGPLKVYRQGEPVDVVPGEMVPEIWDSSGRQRRLLEARGKIVFRPNPSPPVALVRDLVDALSATKAGQAKAQAVLRDHGLESPDALMLPERDPELTAQWEAERDEARRRAEAEAKRVRIEVQPLDREAWGRLERSPRGMLIQLLEEDEQPSSAIGDALGVLGPPSDWPRRALVEAVAISTGVAIVGYAAEHERPASS